MGSSYTKLRLIRVTMPSCESKLEVVSWACKEYYGMVGIQDEYHERSIQRYESR
jgi:hypothetical protein